MNKELRNSHIKNRWSELEVLLDYLREKNCYQSIVGAPKANPYWYGTTLSFLILEPEIESLLKNKSIKIKRMEELAESAETELNSPIVRLTGIVIKRILKNFKF